MKLDTTKLTRYRTQPEGAEVRYNCPKCGDINGKLYANFKKGKWICFHCGAAGSILRRDFADVPQFRFRNETIRQFKWLVYPDIRGTGKLYLTLRNIHPETAWVWGVRSGKGDSESRLVIPVRYRTGAGNRTVFRVAHATTNDLLPKELQSGKRRPLILVWDDLGNPLLPPSGDSDLLWKTNRTAVIVEGAADAFRLAQTARDTSKLRNHLAFVALWGKRMDEETTFHLCSLFEHFYILLDREESFTTGGEATAGLDILHKLTAIACGVVGRHTWTKEDKGTARRGSLAKDPAELNEWSAQVLLQKALRRTGG